MPPLLLEVGLRGLLALRLGIIRFVSLLTRRVLELTMWILRFSDWTNRRETLERQRQNACTECEERTIFVCDDAEGSRI